MNEIVSKFLLAGGKFMPEMHLIQPEFTYGVCASFTGNNKGTQKFKETGDSICTDQNEIDKVFFQHNMAYGDFKDLLKTIASGKILHDKAFNIVKNSKYNVVKDVLLLWFIKFLIESLLLWVLAQRP